MEVTVIIPVYNRERVVQRTLNSVLAQSHRPLQVVLVDNCSTDGSLNVLNRFAAQHNAPDFRVEVTGESRHTAGAARNRGFAQATGEWVLFFDSDDVMHPQLIGRYVSLIARHYGKLDLVSARSRLVMPDGGEHELPFHKTDFMAVQILHSQLATQRYAVRREFFAGTGGWNPDLPGWNDWEMGVRLLLAQPRMAFLDGNIDIDIIHSGKDSITGTEFHSRHGQWEHVIDLVADQVGRSTYSNRRRYLRLLDYRRIALAAQYRLEGHAELATPLLQSALGSLCDSYGNGRLWHGVVKPVIIRLYDRIATGKRGSARVARLLIR
ncbi:MAG: glycosyltransferase family 2 protein [Muribaculaceae bacterium]|nr:glycosyltransferase family 2 protein [Muribaculaceae bacterium]